MTKAQQTISIGLLVSSVRPSLPPASQLIPRALNMLTRIFYQLYLSLYLQLVPLPTLIQTEIIPVVRPPCPATNPRRLCPISPSQQPHAHLSLPQQPHLPLLSAVTASRTQANPPTPQLPLWALVSFGAYLLFKLGYGVFTFNDVPAAHAELMQEIDLARADLRSKGVDVD